VSKIEIRKLLQKDEIEVIRICHKTGYMGEDCAGYFNDRVLFGYFYCTPYLKYEPESCFVAVDKENNQVAGYLIGTPNTAQYEKDFGKKMLWRIISRLIFYTSWKHPESLREVLYWKRHAQSGHTPFMHKDYQAHLHMNVLSEYQRLGIGSRLIDNFEAHLKAKRIGGFFLETSNHNQKAIRFYQKSGLKIQDEFSQVFWSGVSDYKNIILVKKIES
jgi:ribosomal protein S18 acetylase RimI-like enzyme